MSEVDVLKVKPIRYTSQGRAHMACMRCRSRRIKCSGDHPACRNCSIAEKECKYPMRDRKVVILESQLSKMHSRLAFLEQEHSKLISSGTISQSAETEDKDDSEEEEMSSEKDQQIHKQIHMNPLAEHQEVSDTAYFGAASCEVFDNALHSFLVDLTYKERGYEYVHHPQHKVAFPRYYLPDPSVNMPYHGVVLFPDKDYALMLVNRVIEFLGPEYYLFDYEEFEQEISDAYLRLRDKSPLWLCYFLVTLAIGEQYLNGNGASIDHGTDDSSIPGMRFFGPAMKLFKNYYEEPDMKFVQTLLLIGFYCQGLNRTQTVYSFFGLAIRSCLVMGLHRKVTDLAHITNKEVEKRKRVWWTCFCMESIWSSKLGQPLHVKIEDVDVDLPNVGKQVSLNDSYNVDLATSNVYLSTLADKVMTKLYRPITDVSKATDFVSHSLDCLADLEKLKGNLLFDLKESFKVGHDRSVANLYLRINQIVIITARPLVFSLLKGLTKKNSATSAATTICIEAAKENIEILQNLKQNKWLSEFGFWDSQYCFSAMLILVMADLGTKDKYGQQKKIEAGKQLMQSMSKAGNLTAQYNERRLQYLDELWGDAEQHKRTTANSSSDINDFPDLDDLRSGERKMMNKILPFLYNEEDGAEEAVKLEDDFFPEAIDKLASHFQIWDSCNTPGEFT